MSFWWGFLIAYLIMSTLLTVIAVAKDFSWINGDNTVWDGIVAGIVCWIFIAIAMIIQIICKLIKRNKYKSLIQTRNGNIYWCNTNEVDNIIDNSYNDETSKAELQFADYKLFLNEIDLWKKEFVNFNIPNVRFAPKKIWKRYKKWTKTI